MPKVVQYGGPKVQTQIARQPRANASAGNAQFESNQQAAKGLESLATAGADMVQRFDTTSAEEALVQFERDKNNLFFEPENGYFNTQGKNAYDNASSANESLAKLKKKYGESLNANARSMFDSSADVHITRGQADISRHSAKGLQAWEVATINSQVENTIENASLYWNQPDQLMVQNALGRQAVLDSAKIEGIGTEATNERLQTYDSSFNKTAITTAISNSSADGQELFDKYSNRLEGLDRIGIEKEIAAKAKAEKVQSDSQSAISIGRKLINQYDSREEIRNEVNNIEDHELRNKAMTEAMRQFKLKKQGESEEQAASFEVAESHIYEGGSAETFQAEDPEGWERLSANQKKSIRSGEAVVTDGVFYSDTITLPKDELAKINPTDHFHKLAPAERNKLISAVKSAKGTGSSSDKIAHQVGRTRSAQAAAAIEQVLGKRSKWNDKKRVQANSFYDLLDGEVNYREKQKDGPLTSQEFTDVLADLTRNVTIERSAFGIDFLYPDSEQGVKDLSAEETRNLSEMLRADGVEVTSENLLLLKEAIEKKLKDK